MSKDIVAINPRIINLLINSFGKDGLPLPYVKEIFLMECHIAGTSYRENIKEIEKELQEKDLLVFKRETDNQHDKLAIVIFDTKGQKLGYVPRDRNEVIARLMDAGKLIFGKLERKQWQNDWLKADIRVYMRDM
jgi:hypothetical protein